MTKISKSVAIINTKAPFSLATAKEAMDVALIYGSYEQETHLFFQGDGVYQLVAAQQANKITLKDFLKTFAAFEFYDLEHIYVCKQSLIERDLSKNFHIENVQVLAPVQFANALHQHQIILTF